MNTSRYIQIIITVFVAITFLGIGQASGAQSPAEVMDLQKWADQGIPESLRQKMVIQSLSQRSRPVLSGDFILKMVRYGGENLALTYVNLDSATALEAQAPLSPEVMERLMDSGVPRADIEKILHAAQAGASLAAVQPVAVPESLKPASDIVQEDLPPIETVTPQAPRAPLAPQMTSRPQSAEVPNKNTLRKVPQVLYPGVPADPARPMPPEPGPYKIRRPQGRDGIFMGVTEEVKPDGHVYEVNSNGQRQSQGFEVLSRESGHKVHRYFSGQTDRTVNPENNRDYDYDYDEEYVD